MPQQTPNDPAASPPMTQEADIGSGEKTAAQTETDEIIRQIPPLPKTTSPDDDDAPGIVSPS